MSLYKYSKDGDTGRENDIPQDDEPYRTPFRRDYARLVHSAAFRRLQGKTQLFPGIESDFFRNRLTHSLEVAQIAKSIAIRINNTVNYFQKFPINTDLVELAGLAHDLGHPPFGHNGECALDDCMKQYGGFEGNAQTLRILARLEKRLEKGDTLDANSFPFDNRGRDCRKGLNLTYRTLAAILKYDKRIREKREETDGLVKGYYQSEAELVKHIKGHVVRQGLVKSGAFKTVECRIMDVADDIAYSTYDLEDSLKAGFLTPLDIISAREELLTKVSCDVSKKLKDKVSEQDVLRIILDTFIGQGIFDLETIGITKAEIDIDNPYSIGELVGIFYRSSVGLGETGYFRTRLTSDLIDRFIKAVQVKPDIRNPPLSKVYLIPVVLKQVEILKRFTYEALIMSPRLKVVEYRGYDIVRTIFDSLRNKDRHGYLLLPNDFRNLYEKAKTESMKMRILCDFVAGMTDRYAVEFYARLTSEQAQTIYKPS